MYKQNYIRRSNHHFPIKIVCLSTALILSALVFMESAPVDGDRLARADRQDVLIFKEAVPAYRETIYMSILSSRKHRLGALDNPTVGLFISTDGGATWHHRGWTGYIRTFYTEAGPDGTIWSACGNGILRSTDNGSTWRITTGWEITEVLKVKVDPTQPAIVFGATAYGIVRSTDKGTTWQSKNSGLQSTFTADVLIDAAHSTRVFAATEEGVYVSTNRGDQWRLAGLKGSGIRVLAQDRLNSRLLYAGTEEDGVYISVNGGATWNSSVDGLHHRTVYAIAPDPTSSRTIYIGTHGGGVYKSTDGGTTWQQSSKGLINLDVHSLGVLPSNPSLVFAGTLNGGLFRSTDGGLTWQFNSQEEAQVWGISIR
jgi:photosystem II stability/assembly factor-like uncharacterized protein